MQLTDQINFALQSVYIHDLSPFAIKLGGTFGLRWYGLAYLAGFVCAYFIILNLSKKRKIALLPSQVSDFVFFVAVGTILGGRLGYCIFYDPALFTKFSSTFPFWGVFEVHKGGMASHGGVVGVIASCLLFSKREALPKLELLDVVALTACLGIMFGRMANFVNGELVGRPASESYAYAVKFPQDLLAIPYSSDSKMDSLVPIANSLGYTESEIAQALHTHNTYFFEIIAVKAIDQIQAGNQQVKKLAGEILVPRHPSQLYEAFLEGLLLFLLIFFAQKLWPVPGVAGCVFMLAYPLVRIFGEQFRMPDAQIGFQLFGLTRGQWISFLMLAVGVITSYLILRPSQNSKVLNDQA